MMLRRPKRLMEIMAGESYPRQTPTCLKRASSQPPWQGFRRVARSAAADRGENAAPEVGALGGAATSNQGACEALDAHAQAIIQARMTNRDAGGGR